MRPERRCRRFLLGAEPAGPARRWVEHRPCQASEGRRWLDLRLTESRHLPHLRHSHHRGRLLLGPERRGPARRRQPRRAERAGGGFRRFPVCCAEHGRSSHLRALRRCGVLLGLGGAGAARKWLVWSRDRPGSAVARLGRIEFRSLGLRRPAQLWDHGRRRRLLLGFRQRGRLGHGRGRELRRWVG